LRYGIQQAILVGYLKIQIEGDNKAVTPAIQGGIQIPWQLYIIMRDIKNFMSKADQITIHHTFREANFTAG